MGLRVYDPNNDPDQEGGQEKSGESAGAGGAIQTTAGEPASSGKGGSLSQRDKSSSGQFTNIQDYRNANQQGANQMAQGITNKFKGLTNQGNTELHRQQNEFQSAYDTNVDSLSKTNQGVTDAASNNSLTQGNDQQFNDAFSNLTNAINSKYTGPSGLANQGLVEKQAQDASSLGKGTENDPGRLALLQRFYNKPSYNTGQQKLDTLLLGNQGKELKNARLESQNLSNQLPDALNGVNSKVIAGNTLADNTKTAGQGLLSSSILNSNQSLKNELAQFKTDEATRKSGNATDAPTATAQAAADARLGLISRINGGYMSSPVDKSDDLSVPLSTQDLLNGGYLNYNASPIPQDDQSALGLVDPTLAGRINKLYGLTPDDEQLYASGDQLKHGTFGNVDTNQLKDNLSGSFNSILDAPASSLGIKGSTLSVRDFLQHPDTVSTGANGSNIDNVNKAINDAYEKAKIAAIQKMLPGYRF